ncbi:unnamed protein product [Clonostachys rosea]|uniref:F-box domain-containing protein n=1 Tax=Bionectria ochroleuca TaxID=29856 RepID=A0ABY6V0D3_BIOOC|nr:unnamed protein product [Clonostachys rosea]
MADTILMKVPPEILDEILEKVSRELHRFFFDKVWRSVTITPVDEYHQQRTPMQLLTERCLENAQELHFKAKFQYSTTFRCLHEHKEDDEWYTREGLYQGAPRSEVLEEGGEHPPPFESLAHKATSVLAKVKPNSLSSFRCDCSWDLGTCVPAEILGPDGILPQKHPKLQSLSVSNDFLCYMSVKPSVSAFRNLQRLRWRAPNGKQVDALSEAIGNNASHLKELEIDFAHWHTLDRSIRHPYGGLGGDVTRKVFGVPPQGPLTPRTQLAGIPSEPQGIILKEIRSLCLTEVPLTADLAQAMNFQTLESLKLRTCPDWFEFLNAIVADRKKLNLKAFELTDDLGEYEKTKDRYYNACAASLPAFLASLDGLEQLHLAPFASHHAAEEWREFARNHHESLKSFIFHDRSANWDRQSYGSGAVTDSSHVLTDDQAKLFKEDPSQNPLSLFNLNFFGVCCRTDQLQSLLAGFKERNTLKVLHIRQSSAYLEIYNHSSAVSQLDLERAMIANQKDIDSMDFDDKWLNVIKPKRPVKLEAEEVQTEFLDSVRWAFGPEGINSLDILAFGDFSYGCREPQNNLVFSRNRTGNEWSFSLIHVDDEEWQDVLDEYGDAIEACPTDRLLHTRGTLSQRLGP